MRRAGAVLRLAGLAGLLLLYPGVVAAQMGPPPSIDPSGHQHENAADALSAEQKREMVKKQGEQRQLEIKKDTEKLLQLATELKEYVDKTNENIMSMDVVKKAEQIEKLAKSVKDKMKGP